MSAQATTTTNQSCNGCGHQYLELHDPEACFLRSLARTAATGRLAQREALDLAIKTCWSYAESLDSEARRAKAAGRADEAATLAATCAGSRECVARLQGQRALGEARS